MIDPAFKRAISSGEVFPPFGNYSHAIHLSTTSHSVQWLVMSGQLGISKIGAIPEDFDAQAEICFNSIASLLAEVGMSFADVVKLSAFVTRREDFPAYMRVRDRYVVGTPPASTLIIVGGFTRPEMLLEVEALALRSGA
ncbi:MAG: RidA family protein [Pseudomonadales bacterium]|jgi:enamine deaminase RidA (YjgF/YER057c/UK114 family)